MDKALVAGVLAILSIINLIWGIDWFGDKAEEIVGIIISVLMPLFVYFVPNRE
jgi:hypothetical protein